MGAYLSKPVTEKVSSDESNDKLKFGASSMQGWRVYQEDAHNAELDLGGHALFAVYDGHGGHEVATYTAAEFPSFLQKNESFSKGDFEQSLTDTFLEFDGTLIEPKINVMLREIAGRKDQEDSDYAGDEIDHLCREAAMPLEEVMAKYSGDSPQESPNSKNKSGESEDMASTSGSSSSCKRRLKTLHKDSCIDEEEDIEEEMEQSTKEEDKKENIEIETEENIKKSEIINQNENITPKKDVKTDDQKKDVIEKKTDCNGASDKCVNGKLEDIVTVKSPPPKVPQINGEISDEGGGDDVEKATETSSSQKENEENGPSPSIKGITGKGAKEGGHKGKAVAKTFGVSVGTARRAMMNPLFRQIRLASLQRSSTLVSHEDDDEDDDEDEDEEEEEKCSGEEDSSSQDEDEDDEEEEDDDDDDDDDDDNESGCSELAMRDEPGYDSGCTACVSLIVWPPASEEKSSFPTLLVGNAGDSRCVVCRAGKAIDMSVDHKPEDDVETLRIVRAGGTVTPDGRVNGGLNLSRALGDHSYKQNKQQLPKDQMISALPDVKTLPLTAEDNFMVLACDGIWNSLSSQEVCDFVATRIRKNVKLSVIAEELFDHCLCPDAHGDGTGCDNMTCIVVQFEGTTLPPEPTKQTVQIKSGQGEVEKETKEEVKESKEEKDEEMEVKESKEKKDEEMEVKETKDKEMKDEEKEQTKENIEIESAQEPAQKKRRTETDSSAGCS